MTEFLTEDNKKTISLAYDLHSRDEFLKRIHDYINRTVETIQQYEKLKYDLEVIQKELFNGVKTKPGKLARSTETQES